MTNIMSLQVSTVNLLSENRALPDASFVDRPPRAPFGEGIVAVGDEIIQLTWRARTGIVWNMSSLTIISNFSFATTTGEGWGATFDENFIVVSDGSNVLHYWHPTTYREVRRKEIY